MHRLNDQVTGVLRILLVKESPADARLIEFSLAKLPFPSKVVRVDTLQDIAVEIEQFPPDCVLSDYSLAGFNGVDVLAVFNDRMPKTPVIIVSGANSEEIAVRCMHAGATDYISKDQLHLLGPAIQNALRLKHKSDATTQAEAALRQSEATLRHIADNVSDLIAVVNPEGIRLDNSLSYKEILNDPANLRGTDSFQEIHPEDRERIKEIFAETIRTGVGKRSEYRFLLKDGSVRHIESQGNVVSDSTGKPSRVVIVSRDVTERKQNEERLRTSEQRFRSLIEHSSEGIALVDAGGTIIYAGPSTERILGYSAVEFTGINAFSLIHPDDHPETTRLLTQLVQQSDGSASATYRMKHKDGTWRWMDGIGTNLLGDPAVGAIVVNYRDITERKETVEALRTSEERYRAFVEQSSEAIWRFELDQPMPLTLTEDHQIDFIYAHGYLAQCNDVMARMYGRVRAEELQGTRLKDLLIRSDQRNIEYLQAFLRSGYRLLNAESHEPDNEGIMRYFLNNLVGMVESGHLVRAWGTQRDISDRKQTESRLAMLAHALRSIAEGVALTDIDDNILFVNDAFLRMYGYREDELIGRHIGNVRSARNAPELAETILGQTLRDGWKGELWDQRKDGTEFLVSLSRSVVRGETGEPLALMSVAQDITEKKRADKLQDAVYRIAQAADAAPQLDDLYVAVHRIIQEVMPANNFYIALYDESDDLLHFSYFVDEVDVPSPPMPPGKGLTAYVLRTGRSLLCPDDILTELIRNGEAELVGAPSPIWLGVPLIVANKTIGAMVVQHYADPKAYGVVEQHMLEFVSSQVAKVIETKRSEVALRESEERYRQMFEDDLTGDFISTPEGKIHACNPAFARIFGFGSVDEALKSDYRVLHSGIEARNNIFEAVRKMKKLEYYETELRRKDGKPIHVVANLIGTFNDQGDLTSVKGYLFDETDRKRLEDQLLQAQKMEAVGQLASGIAHDFNNVMGVTLTAAQMIKHHSSDLQVVRYANMVEETTLRGAAIAKQLLQFSRAEAAKLSPVSLSHIVTEVKKILDHSFPKTIEITISINMKQGVIMGDEGQIHQVLLNLCINARDAMLAHPVRDGGNLTIALESTPGQYLEERFGLPANAEHAVLRVSDTGTGIPPEVQRRIFEPFFTTKEIGKGTGLGLSIVHGIVKAHHGQIEVQSRLGEGTTFSVYFPIIAQRNTSEMSSETWPSQGSGETILVIEDEEILRSLIVDMLKKAGYLVLEARDGEEGVAVYTARKDEIDLVVSDMGLPKLSGEQVFRQLRKINPSVKVLFSTGFIREEKKKELLDAGAIDFIHKPYKIAEMLNGMRQALDYTPELA
ncbi:MAG: PAS domain S-box protein [Bacteroidota bacterium]